MDLAPLRRAERAVRYQNGGTYTREEREWEKAVVVLAIEHGILWWNGGSNVRWNGYGAKRKSHSVPLVVSHQLTEVVPSLASDRRMDHLKGRQECQGDRDIGLCWGEVQVRTAAYAKRT